MTLPKPTSPPQATAETSGRVVLFATCYGNRNEPDLATDLAAVFAHNGIEIALPTKRALLRHAQARAGRFRSRSPD